jgi:acyl-CoA synthetase (AMP-forming)/AMP-acid ligase II
MGYPLGADTAAGGAQGGRPVYLAMAPLTHAAGVLCFPVMALGGEIVVMAKPDLGEFLALVEHHRVTHTFLPPTLIYMLLAHEKLAATDLSSLRCFWYGAAPMSPERLEQALTSVGPVMAQLFGQVEAPMMISMLPPSEHFRADGSVARERLSSAGRPAPLVTVAIMAEDGTLLPPGERGEIVVRSSLVMAGYYKNPAATAEASRHGWHHTGDIGYLDDDNYLFIVDRAKDMIIAGGFNVYSAEVEQALMAHPAVRDCGVVGLPDEKWGERVVAVVQPQADAELSEAELVAFAKERIGSVKAPKQVYVWPDLPRSTVRKVLKTTIRKRLHRLRSKKTSVTPCARSAARSSSTCSRVPWSRRRRPPGSSRRSTRPRTTIRTASGSRPASRAPPRTVSTHAPIRVRSWRLLAIQPWASRPARRSAGAAAPPSSTGGCGRCTGGGPTCERGTA